MRSADPFAVELERFQGPLDLLLHLIRKQDIDIFDISIAKVTRQFLGAVERMQRLELDRAGEFLEVAATLVRIKAQMLFPAPVEHEADDPRAELVRRLLEYEHFREAARVLERAERERARHRARGYTPPRTALRAAVAPLHTGWAEVEQALASLAARLSEPEPEYRVRTPSVRVEEKIELVLEALADRRRVEFSALVSPWGTRMHAVTSLLACLELAKRHLVWVRQAVPFAALWVMRPAPERP